MLPSGMSAITPVQIAPLPIDRFREVLDGAQYADLVELSEHAQALLAGRVVWCVNSTARGGGVAEMLRSLLAYTRGAGVDTRWVVVNGSPGFFDVTKRLHNRLHGSVGDAGALFRERELLQDGENVRQLGWAGEVRKPEAEIKRIGHRLSIRRKHRARLIWAGSALVRKRDFHHQWE